MDHVAAAQKPMVCFPNPKQYYRKSSFKHPLSNKPHLSNTPPLFSEEES